MTRLRCFLTFRDSSVLEAGVAHPDRCQSPSSLRYGSAFRRAAVAEAFSARPAVVLGVAVAESLAALGAVLQHFTESHRTTGETLCLSGKYIITQECGEGRAADVTVLFFL